MRCDECFRQHGNDDACQHCGHVPTPASSSIQLAAVEAARQLLATARANKDAEETNDE